MGSEMCIRDRSTTALIYEPSLVRRHAAKQESVTELIQLVTPKFYQRFDLGFQELANRTDENKVGGLPLLYSSFPRSLSINASMIGHPLTDPSPEQFSTNSDNACSAF